MTMNSRSYSFDANMLLSDGAAAVSASGYAQVGGVDALLDLGGRQGVTPAQQARIDAMLVIDVSAIDITSTDERYRLKVMGCNASNFSANVVELASIGLGKGSAGTPNTQADSAVGRYELPFTNEQNGTPYEFIKLYVEETGTTPSITFTAFVAVLPEP